MSGMDLVAARPRSDRVPPRPEGAPVEFAATVRIDTASEADYYRHGGILAFVYRSLLAG
jgi:aconitate hydratase